MTPEPTPFNITIPVYEGVDLMDVAAPFEMFNWMGYYWKERAVSVKLAAASTQIVKTRDGFTLTPDLSFEDCYRQELHTDLLWVPGGGLEQLQTMMGNTDYLKFLLKQSENASYVTSVCEGAMLLANAGLLDGYEATTHWAFINCLKQFKEIKVADGFPRFVVDRNRVTGGGISSGLDEALQLVALISSNEIAEQVQVVTQYFPRPPVNGNIPEPGTCPLNLDIQKT